MHVLGAMNVMKWPWQVGATHKRLVMSWAPGELAFVEAQPHASGWAVSRLGTERQGADSEQAFHKRLQALGLHDPAATVVLRPSQYQLLQIEAPAVPAQELRSAVRWQVAGMVTQAVETLVMDVMPVGDSQVRITNQVFVVAAEQAVVAHSLALARVLGAEVGVIDIQDATQRNLQLQALAQDTQDAHAAVVLLDEAQALLTISAQGELQYSRRLDLEPGVVDGVEQAGRERWATEIQRSLDVWDRTAPMLPIARLSLYAAQATAALSHWLGQYLGQAVYPMEPVFEGLSSDVLAEYPACWSLLGGLLRPLETA